MKGTKSGLKKNLCDGLSGVETLQYIVRFSCSVTRHFLCLSYSGQIHPLSPSAEIPYAVVNKLRKKSLETDVDFSSCSHQVCLFKIERFQ